MRRQWHVPCSARWRFVHTALNPAYLLFTPLYILYMEPQNPTQDHLEGHCCTASLIQHLTAFWGVFRVWNNSNNVQIDEPNSGSGSVLMALRKAPYIYFLMSSCFRQHSACTGSMHYLLFSTVPQGTFNRVLPGFLPEIKLQRCYWPTPEHLQTEQCIE